jgi:hypothetical protein
MGKSKRTLQDVDYALGYLGEASFFFQKYGPDLKGLIVDEGCIQPAIYLHFHDFTGKGQAFTFEIGALN